MSLFPLTRLTYQKVRAVEERDTYAQFIRTKTHPSIYYQPKEYSETTKKALKESNQRVNSECLVSKRERSVCCSELVYYFSM